MKLGVIGSRTFPVPAFHFAKMTPEQKHEVLGRGRAIVRSRVRRELARGNVTVVVSGGARGPDTWGAELARELGYKLEEHIPKWKQYGKAAGFKRNTLIAKSSDLLLAFWDGKSGGTLDTITKGHSEGKKVIVVLPNGKERTNGTRVGCSTGVG